MSCRETVALLNKSDITSGKKIASDPAYNLAAQLLATELNFRAGAGKCASAVTAETQAQANSLATALDRYNKNLLC